LVEGPSFGWSSPFTWLILFTGAALGVAFVAVEKRSADPLMPFEMLRNRWLILGTAVSFLFMATFGALLYFLSLYFQNVLGFDALQTGLAFLLPTAVVVIASAVAGRLATKLGLRATMIGALAVGALGALAIGFAISTDRSLLALAPGLVAVSIGDGITFTAMFIAASTGVPDRRQGVASGIVSTASGVGAAIGLAVLVLIAAVGTNAPTGPTLQAAQIARVSYAIAAGVLLTLILVIANRPPDRVSLA
jgi:MFS family permease